MKISANVTALKQKIYSMNIPFLAVTKPASPEAVITPSLGKKS